MIFIEEDREAEQTIREACEKLDKIAADLSPLMGALRIVEQTDRILAALDSLALSRTRHMNNEYPDDYRIEALAPAALAGDSAALNELRVIYERGEFDPGFGRELDALLHKTNAQRACP